MFVETSCRSFFTFVLFSDDALDEIYQRIGDGLAWVIVATMMGGMRRRQVSDIDNM
ncbi:MAG: hypothetical protein ABIG43_03235 [Chloroflexota bacterium]